MSFKNPSGLRRTRSENFSAEEVKVLVREYDARQTQVNDPSESFVAWLAIASHVTAVAGISRNVKQCKVKIANLNCKNVTHATATTAATNAATSTAAAAATTIANTTDSIQGSSGESSQQPQGFCLFCSEPLDRQNIHCLITKDLAVSICEVLRLKSTSTGVLSFEHQFLNFSLCPNCFENAAEAQQAIEELSKLNERIILLSTAIEQSIVLGVKNTDGQGFSSSSSPAKLRLSIVKALNLDLSSYDVELNAPIQDSSSTSLYSDTEENLYNVEFEDTASPASPDIENSEDVDVEQDQGGPDAQTVSDFIIRTDIFEDGENQQILSYDEAEEGIDTPSNISSTGDRPKDPLRLEIFGSEDSDEYQGRNRNFTPKEVKALLIEYTKRKEILEGPGSQLADTKRRLWEEIASIVTSMEGFHRNTMRCKKKLENIKWLHKDIDEYLKQFSQINCDNPPKRNVLQLPINRAQNNTSMYCDTLDSTDSEAGSLESSTFRRNKNFTPKEIKGLLVEYEKRKESLESPNAIISNSVKQASWNEIATLVTSIEGVPRDAKQCRKKFEAMKYVGISEWLENFSNIVYDESNVRNQVFNDLLDVDSDVADSSGIRVKRSINFTPREVKGLLVEFEKKKVALENLATPKAVKQSLWEEISVLVTSISGVSRNVQQCKKKLDNLKIEGISECLQKLSHIEYDSDSVFISQVISNSNEDDDEPEEVNYVQLLDAVSNHETFEDFETLLVEDCTELTFHKSKNKSFTSKELKAFLVEYEKRKAILEGPGPSNDSTKLSLWAEIAIIVSSIEGVPRSVMHFKQKLNNLKKSGDISAHLLSLSDIEYDESLAPRNIIQVPSTSNNAEPTNTSTRNCNFTHRETKTVLEEYEKRKAIFDSLSSNSSDNAARLTLWEEISAVVTSVRGIDRDVDACRTKLKNLKTQCNGDLSGLLSSLSEMEKENGMKAQEYCSVEADSVAQDDTADQMTWSDPETEMENSKRNKNFTLKEVKAFLVEYEKRKGILESQGYNGMKFELWEEIATIVSSVEGIERDVNQCKTKLRNLKAQCGGDISGHLVSLSHVEYNDEDSSTNLDAAKPRRNYNFSPKEIKYLILEYEKRKATLEGPGHSNSKAKINLWEEIALIVSSIEGIPRDTTQVRKKYLALMGKKTEWLESLSHIEYDEALHQNLVATSTSTNDVDSMDEDFRRSVNFSRKETKALLVEYVKRRTKLEEKITQSQHLTNYDKKKLWREIAVIVSSMDGELRTVLQCKNRIKNLRSLSNGDLPAYLHRLSDVEYDDSSIDLKALRVKFSEETPNVASSEEESATDFEPSSRVKRTKNFTPKEIKAFLIEYEKRKEILEDLVSENSIQKMTLWEEIASILCSVEGIHRNVYQCKMKLKNLRYLCGDFAIHLGTLSHIEYESKPAFTKPEVILLMGEYKKRESILAKHLSSESANTEIWKEIGQLVTDVSGVERTGDECRKRVLSVQHSNRTKYIARRPSQSMTGTCLIC